MRFAHMADCHIGAWNDPKMRQASIKAFERAVDICIKEGVDFVLIAGDLFNTSLPGIDSLKATVKKLRELKENDITVYVIPGSHDFSPSGKTMLEVLEEAGLVINVSKGDFSNEKIVLKFTTDKKTGARITGMVGRKGGLEKVYYKGLDKTDLEKQKGFKIFMFHTALEEFKPKGLEKIEASPLSLLPKDFDYYAGGHVHYVFNKQEKDYGTIAYPGPLFPNNFKELEELENGGFYIVNVNKKIEPSYQPIVVYNVFSVRMDCNNKTPEEVHSELIEEFQNKEFVNTIVTIRLFGILKTGKTPDINFKDIMKLLQTKGAVFVMKNTHKLSSKEFKEVKIKKASVEEIEEELIKEHTDQINVEGWDQKKQIHLIKTLMKILDTEKGEDEKVADFEKRIDEEAKNILD
ncbi:hypothetical protein A3K72_00110 [Candidatus Woesearchaeota archaeon RBG_13_36_6]|nr:MAG: hypothetical protein A3K72_00110 [Candidatus Woesearchaeota archaeon RBG_13_36_6]